MFTVRYSDAGSRFWIVAGNNLFSKMLLRGMMDVQLIARGGSFQQIFNNANFIGHCLAFRTRNTEHLLGGLVTQLLSQPLCYAFDAFFP